MSAAALSGVNGATTRRLQPSTRDDGFRLNFVYFCSIVITSIGIGDIAPTHHITKLATSIVGITGQMYSVVLLGILVSKCSSASADPAKEEPNQGE